MPSVQRLLLIIVFILTLSLVLMSQFTFFRHDDWLMLGNSVTILPQDWSFLWSHELYFSPTEKGIWFFRPLFKGMVWLGYQAFGYHHSLWMFFQWFLILASIFIGTRTFYSHPQSLKKGYVFSLLSVSCIAFYLPSLVWMGEGMMNIPQVFLLSLAVFLFFHSNLWAQIMSLFCFLLALGFKESSAFLPLFLIGKLLAENTFNRRWKWLIPHFVLMGAYLIFRLGLVPMNPGYMPQISFSHLLKPIFFFGAALCLPLVVLLIDSYSGNGTLWYLSLRRFCYFTPFISLLVAPHLGHGFFSPGWFFLPGFFTLWSLVISLEIPLVEQISQKRLVVLALFFSLLPVLWKAHELRWWEWRQSQLAVYDWVEKSPNSVTDILIEQCNSSQNSSLTFERVVGGPEHIEHLWKLKHPGLVTVHLVPCDQTSPDKEKTPKHISARWSFPDFIIN
ncbi:MAG: hypothetical protein EB078_01540 [Proteobacteria bacterium]|nr:hypothetical protein [Pseudomonadota bacterium]